MVTYTPNSAGRTVSAVDSVSNINYATAATYQADGQMTGFTSGQSASFTGITNSFTYNNRLQPITMSAVSPSQTVFSIGYDFHWQNSDNGNVFGITNYRDANRSQTFSYDALNRLTYAQNAGTNCTATTVNGKTEYWGNAYSYDAWGNLTNKNLARGRCGGESLSLTVLANNRVANAGYGYDAAGNMTSDATEGLTLNYDAENRITGAGGYTYTYDADGNRVEKSNGSTGTLYWYMTPGIVAESDLSGVTKSEYVFFNGERVARRDFGPTGPTGVFYYFSDHLKTASVITDSAGNIKSDSDYYPWGGELQFVANDSNHYKFTGKERDTETGLDYFGARYYSNGLGRFITPDWAAKAAAVPYADFADPQSLNLYIYVRNVPTTRYDADGHQTIQDKTCPAQNSVNKFDLSAKSFKEAAKGFFKGLVNRALSPFNSAVGLHQDAMPIVGHDQQIGANVANQVVAAAPLLGELKPVTTTMEVVDMTAAQHAPSVINVVHYTDDAGVAAITEAGGVLRGGGSVSGTFVTTPSEIPAGATSSDIESLLEIGPGKGTNSVTFQTSTSNLTTPANGADTSGGATQYQLKKPTKIDPSRFKKTDGGGA